MFTPTGSMIDIVAGKRLRLSSLAVIALAISGVVSAQDDIEAPMSDLAKQEEASLGRIFTPEEFARFAPRNALDMLNQVPG